MSNSRQFLVPSNYDITKPIYPTDDIVRKKAYLIDEVKSSKQYHQLYTHTFQGEKPSFYADKLRRRANVH